MQGPPKTSLRDCNCFARRTSLIQLEEQTTYWNPDPAVTRVGCDENRFSSFRRLKAGESPAFMKASPGQEWNR
jgi:hypothetical protein